MKVGTLLHPSWLVKALLNGSSSNILSPLIEKCAQDGASHIELTGEIFTLAPAPILQMLTEEIQGDLLRLKEEGNLSFSVHLPQMGGLDLSTSIESIRKITVETYRTLVELTKPLEPECYVLHIAGMIHELTGGTYTGKATPHLRKFLMSNVSESS